MKEKLSAKQKKVGVIIAAVLLLVLAVYLNYRINAGSLSASTLNNTDQETPEPSNTIIPSDTSVYAGTDYFAAFRENRELVRAREIEYLDAIIADSRTDAETLKDAQTQKIDIVNNMEKEFTVESLLLAKGFRDVAVTLHQGSVNVVVDSEPLTSEQAAQILDIVIRETGEKAENVKVSAQG